MAEADRGRHPGFPGFDVDAGGPGSLACHWASHDQLDGCDPNADGTVLHYHVLISPEPDCKMYYSADVPSYDLGQYVHPFD
jgi:hypothetical protein